MDGRLACLREAIGACGLDFVEGFTPPPIGDLGIEEARASWPDTALWVNIPGTLFLGSRERVLAALGGILRRAQAAGRCLLTLTEEFPDPPRSLLLLSEALAADGAPFHHRKNLTTRDPRAYSLHIRMASDILDMQ